MKLKTKLKSIIAILLILCMTSMLFTACNSGGEPAPGSSDAGSNVGNDGGDDDEMVTINMWWPQFSGAGIDENGTKAMEDAFNAITEEKLNVHVDFTWLASSDFQTQLSLAVSNQEQIDIMSVSPGTFTTYYSNGILMDITDVINDVAPDLLTMFGDLASGTSVDGRVYSVPAYRNLASNQYIIFREDVLESVGMVDFVRNELDSWSEYEQVMEAIKNEGSMSAVGGSYGYGVFTTNGLFPSGDKFADSIMFDQLGDGLFVIYSNQETGAVESAWTRPEQVEQFKMVKDWNDKGYIWADMLYNQDSVETNCKMGSFASFFIGSEFGVETNKSQSVGTPVVAVEIMPGIINTAMVRKFNIAIPASSQEPVAAMKVIHELYTNAELMTLFCYGIEGKNYVLDEDGVANYPEGTDAQTCGYHGFAFWGGNTFLLPPWGTEGVGFYEASMENFQNAQISVFAGISVDTSEMDVITSNLKAVYDEFYGQLDGGLYSDELYNEFIEKAKAAGMDEYVKLYADNAAEFLAD